MGFNGVHYVGYGSLADYLAMLAECLLSGVKRTFQGDQFFEN
jgi:hypothetical protein